MLFSILLLRLHARDAHRQRRKYLLPDRQSSTRLHRDRPSYAVVADNSRCPWTGRDHRRWRVVTGHAMYLTVKVAVMWMTQMPLLNIVMTPVHVDLHVPSTIRCMSRLPPFTCRPPFGTLLTLVVIVFSCHAGTPPTQLLSPRRIVTFVYPLSSAVWTLLFSATNFHRINFHCHVWYLILPVHLSSPITVCGHIHIVIGLSVLIHWLQFRSVSHSGGNSVVYPANWVTGEDDWEPCRCGTHSMVFHVEPVRMHCFWIDGSWSFMFVVTVAGHEVHRWLWSLIWCASHDMKGSWRGT